MAIIMISVLLILTIAIGLVLYYIVKTHRLVQSINEYVMDLNFDDLSQSVDNVNKSVDSVNKSIDNLNDLIYNGNIMNETANLKAVRPIKRFPK